MPAGPLDSVASNADPAAARRAWHLAIRAQFLVLGLALGARGAQVPSVKSDYALNERSLSIALFDLAINAEGNTVKTEGERKLMSGLHAMFSLGGMAGALLCSGLHRLAAPAGLQLAATTVALVPALLWAGARASGRHALGDEAQAPIASPRGALLWIGLLTALCMVAEGEMHDWSALFVRQELRTSEATGALGFAAFSAVMAAGRLVGDRVREPFATLMLLRGSGVLAVAGMALALSVGSP